ncbi:MAG: transposase [Solirubrobacterales bacterium]|nr:transposase [Solirubrobacterales bacterium]
MRAELRQISRGRPRWGYRRAHQLLLEQGWRLNRKRTQRLWRGRASGCPSGGASANGWASRRCRPSGCEPSGPTMCGRSTISSTRPPTVGC